MDDHKAADSFFDPKIRGVKTEDNLTGFFTSWNCDCY